MLAILVIYLLTLVEIQSFQLSPTFGKSYFQFTKINSNSPTATATATNNNRKNADILSSTSIMTDGKSNRFSIKRKPEVLAPAGGWPQLRAAVNSGADACYFGLEEGFNARARASNFKLDELKEVMSFLHDHSVKGYLALNILVFDNELSQLKNIIKQVSEAGVDALIMQDVGAVKYIRQLAPNLPIHGSTQMSITDGHGSLFAGSLGVERVVVGRELSIKEIHSVVRSCGEVEVEAFVHGALCVSYSGQCFSSEAWGGRRLVCVCMCICILCLKYI